LSGKLVVLVVIMLFKRTIGLCLLVFLVSFYGETARADIPADEAVVTELVNTFDADLAALRLLVEEAEKAEQVDRQALVFRQDDRSFTLLADADRLAAAAANLPQGNRLRKEVVDHLAATLKNTSDAVLQRLHELDQQINKFSESYEDMSPDARVSSEAYVQALEAIRFRYLDALISHYKSRKLLGFSYEDAQEQLKQMLYLRAESLVGTVEMLAAAEFDVGSRLSKDPANADLKSAKSDIAARRAEAVKKLTIAVELLDTLEVDTKEYRSVLLKQQTGVTIEMLQVDVLQKMTSEGMAHLRQLLVKNSPSLVLNTVLFVLILVVFRFIARLVKRVVRASCERSSLDMSVLLKDILESASGSTVMILGVLMALSQIGISLGPMLAGLGVAGFIVGFALQDTLANFAAGAMILIYRPYDVDDFVEVTGASGLVKHMSLVSTTITTFDNQTLVVPNSKIWGDVIKNVTAQKVRRVDLEFGIGYQDDIEKAETVLADILSAHELVLKAPAPMIKVHSLGDSSVNLVVRPWTKTENYWDVHWDLTREVKLRFDREGISIPFPQRDVHLYREDSTV
jgi:small conductance mechanosensitive channel